MERKNRPLGRKKQDLGGTAHVGRRKGSGPVGGGPVGGKRPSGGDRSGLDDLGNLLGGMAGGTGSNHSGGGHSGKSSPLGLIIGLVIALLLGGGGGLTMCNGGLDLGGLMGGSVPTPAPVITSGPTGSVDTAVSTQARDKRVHLLGNGRDTTTIMVYMCGTDLESNGGFATKDLQEMTAADIGDQVNLLVYTGGCKQWRNSVISASKNQIYQVRDGGLALMWENSSLQPMTNPDTLAGFIQWSVANCPADRYELIFWDHGGGSVSGYGYDEVNRSAGSMTLDGIAKALQKGGCTFDFIGFDACLMATLETALVVEPYADYLIASEETEPGCGWYYTNWLTALTESPSMTALEMGKNIADDFVSVCGKVAAGQQATLSVMDLAELAGTVPGPFQKFAQTTAQSIKSNNYQSVATARGKTKEFAQSSNIDQIDLIHLADNLGTAEAKALAKALRGAVKYNATSRNIQNANGVSIYFPYGRSSNVNTAAKIYHNIGLDSAYTDCIRAFASLEVAGQSVAGGSTGQLNSLFGALLGGGLPSGSSNPISSSGIVSGDMITQLLGSLLTGRSLPDVGLTQEQAEFLDADVVNGSVAYLAEHQFDTTLLTWTQKGGQQVLVLPEDQWDLVQDVELNVFVDDGEGYIDLGLDNVFDFNDDGDLMGVYDRSWLTVNGQVVAYYMLQTEGTEEDYTILGRIPAMLNGQRVDLMVSFTDEVPGGEILGAAPDYDEDSETATVARGLLELADGDVIDFLCDYYDYNRNFQDAYYLGDPITVNGALRIGNMSLDNADYIAAYRITDIYHNYYWTPSM